MKKQKPQIPIPQAVAACTAFAAFSVSVFVGLAAENPTSTVLLRALFAMLVGFCGGFMIGLVCDWIVNKEIARVEAGVVVDPSLAMQQDVGPDGMTGVDVIEELPIEVADPSRQSDARVIS